MAKDLEDLLKELKQAEKEYQEKMEKYGFLDDKKEENKKR